MSRYHLQKYAGISSRHTCPACERPRCFTLSIDDNGNALHPTVGRCDHESSCGYHRTPRQYFHDHPEHRLDRSHYHHDRHQYHPERSEGSFTRHARPDRASPDLIPPSMISPPSGTNHLITYLKTMLPSSAIDRHHHRLPPRLNPRPGNHLPADRPGQPMPHRKDHAIQPSHRP